MVLAFYYVWFTSGSSRWRVAKDLPLLGRYNSVTHRVISKHCEWAKKYGIDGFIISFWKEDKYGGIRRVEEVVKVLERCGLGYSFYVENGNPIAQIDTLLNHFGDGRNLIRIGGKPLIFLFRRVVNHLSMEDRRKLMALSDRVHLSLYGFNGLNGFTSGNMHTYIDFVMDVREARELCDYTHAFGGLCALPVSPGFDLKPKPKMFVSRDGGRLYVRQWERAIGAGADIVLITSFNEWEEGTHVEPSKRYGFKYLRLTRRMARKFKRRVKGRKITFKPVRFKEERVCFLPGGSTPISLFLSGIVKSGGDYSGCRIVVYDRGEVYDPQVARGLLKYVKEGGTLLLAGGPFPMFRTYEGKEEPFTSRFGLRIGFGPDLREDFGGIAEVEGKGHEFRYFAVGETRVRTLENPHVSHYVLRRYGEPLGTVVGERRWGMGKIVFIWKGVGEQPYLPHILNDVLR